MTDENDSLENDSEVTESEDHLDAADASSTASGGDPSKRKKKKKKKKKSKEPSSDGSASEEAASPTHSGSNKQAHERRYNMAIEHIKQGEDMWVLLSGSNIRDAKARKLADALRANTSITSVNLCSNHIGDEGIQALAAMLKEGGASDLIQLDLRDNPLSEAAEHMLEEVRGVRKNLKIDIGPLPSPSSGGAGSPPGAAAAAVTVPSGPSSPKGNHLPLAGGSDFRTSPMFKRYFQAGDEEEVLPTEEESEPSEEPVDPAQLWDKVLQVLTEGVAAIPQLSDLLHTVCLCLEMEMPAGEMPPDGEEAVPVEQFRPHIRHAVMHLEQLREVLALTPPPVVLQHTKQPQPAVGSHRLWAADILVFLLLPSHSTLDRLVAASQLLPHVYHLALTHDTSSTLHARMPQLLRNAMASKVQELWQPLCQPGMGLGLQLDGAPCPPLHSWLVMLADGAKGQPVGRRCGRIGLVVELAQVLLQATDAANTEMHSAPVHQLLQADDGWVGSIEPGGALHQLLQEQEGELCGPRPDRPEVPEGGEEGGGLGNLPPTILTGTQILNLMFKDMTSSGFSG